jgi:hypothetical protein
MFNDPTAGTFAEVAAQVEQHWLEIALNEKDPVQRAFAYLMVRMAPAYAQWLDQNAAVLKPIDIFNVALNFSAHFMADAVRNTLAPEHVANTSAITVAFQKALEMRLQIPSDPIARIGNTTAGSA